MTHIISVVFNEVMTNYVHLPWMEYIQHSNRFHLRFHFSLHRQSEKEGGENFLANLCTISLQGI